MKKSKTLLLSLSSILIFTCFYSCSNKLRQAARNNAALSKQIIGTWQLSNLRDSTEVTNYFGAGMKRRKIIAPGTFVVVDFTDQQKAMRAAFMGSYSVENGVYTEMLQYTGGGYQKYLGEKNTFEIKVNDDFMTIRGINNNYGLELWKRVK
ncbi:hypothetical protein ABIB40_002889 [Pedobacter sp. UYP30]|uniref:hypothetical protein n=1 Tax=Pedobacter sp. UYP30 TaxID=1756400 RepID=UPI003398DA53